MLQGHVVDNKGVQRSIQFPCLTVPGLGRNLFSVKQAARNGLVSIFDMTNPKLETHNHTFPPKELGSYSFSLDVAGGGNGPKLGIQAAANASLWYRRLGHLNRKSLNLLNNLDNNIVSLTGLCQTAMCAPWSSVTSRRIERPPNTRLNSLSNSFSQRWDL